MIKNVACFMLFIFLSAGYTQEPDFDLAEISLQELADIQVTLVSRKQEKVLQSAAAVFVLTHEDIERSGATSIPEALRLVPGMQVARIDANKWAVSTRGFIGRFANKLLVLIDGRTVYSPLFSGVFWSMQDVLLEDVDRIEVIRGTGATMWGANAVNGIINIVTKNAKDTQGGFVAGGVGTEERAYGALRYGTELSEGFYVRGFSKYIKRDNAIHLDGATAADGWDIFHGGFRADWEKSPSHPMTLQSEFYFGQLGHTLDYVKVQPPRMERHDYQGDIQGFYTKFNTQTIFDNASVFNVQSYVDYMYRDEGITKGRLTTFDMDADYLFDLGRRHQVIVGAGFRSVKHAYDNTFMMAVHPSERVQNQYSAFIQDDIQIKRNLLRLTIGSKFEQHFYTGFEYQPNLRMIYTPNQNHTVWAAVSRAVRTPSLSETEGIHVAYVDSIPSSIPYYGDLDLPGLYGFWGNPDFHSEVLIAFEAGYRYCPTNAFFLDISPFYNHYNNLISAKLGNIVINPEYISIFVTDENKIAGNIFGIELLMNCQALKNWELQASLTGSKANMHTYDGGILTFVDHVANIEGQCPRYFGYLKSHYSPRKYLQCDVSLKFMDALPELDINGYVNMDCRLGLQINKKLNMEFVGQNLINNKYVEFKPELGYTQYTKIERGVYTKVTWTF